MTAIALTTSTKLRVVESNLQATGIAAETIALGAIVRVDTSSGKVTNAKATAYAESRVFGQALRAAAAGEAVTVLIDGITDGFDVSALDYDADVFLSDTDGVLADTPGTLRVPVGRVVPMHAVTIGTSPDKVLRISSAFFGSAAGGGLKTVGGQKTTASAADTVATGLSVVVAAVASYETDPADANDFVSCQIGDQAGSPVAGSIIIKTWKSADGADVTPTAATAFTKKVNWIAWGY